MVRLVMVCEAAADFRLATALVDRICVQQIAWLEPAHLEHLRSWIGLNDHQRFITWQSVRDLAYELRIRVHGFFGRESAKSDAAAAKRALLIVQRLIPASDGVVLLRDLDDDHERVAGLNQARDSMPPPPQVVIGAAICNRESWVLCGFECRDDHEQAVLDDIRQELGFCPCSESERLNHKEHSKRSAKRALQRLTNGNVARETSCWMETSLERLHNQGRQNGLSSFLTEIGQRFVPLF